MRKKRVLTRTMGKMLAVLSFMVALSAALAISGQAGMVIDFDVLGPNGSITFAGGTNNPLIGTDIPIDWVAGLRTPMHSSPPSYPITGGLLNFKTGNFAAYYGPPAQSFLQPTWAFYGGGELTITGTVWDGLIPVAQDALVFNGYFQSASVQATNDVFMIAMAIFTDSKNADLLAFFGVPWAIGQPLPGLLNLSFMGSGSGGGAITSSSIVSGDVANSIPIPAPATLLLLGSGLLGLVGLRYRRRKAGAKN